MNLFIVLFIGLHLHGKVVGSMKVTTSTATLERPEGHAVQMNCAYETDSENMQALDIEWLLVDAPKPVVMLTDGQVFTPLEGQNSRYNFTGNYLSGDASIMISSTKTSDSGKYICKVKKHGDISSVDVKLTVLVKPIPICSLEGGQPNINDDVKMKCNADIGTPEISYTWTRLNSMSTLPIATLGELWLKNVTVVDSGLYQCNASNKIGFGVCTSLLSVKTKNASSSSAGNVAGAVIGVLLLLVALAALGYFVYWYYTKRSSGSMKTKNRPSDLYEDGSSPPTSRPPTRHSDHVYSHDSDDEDYRNELPPSHLPPPPTNDQSQPLYTNVELPLSDEDGYRKPSEKVLYASIRKSDDSV
uniref:CXADR-like membrane protein isoform X2 n=1 Tax=Myxine glutinosa TaxID=7769 RepID=UPI00358E8874